MLCGLRKARRRPLTELSAFSWRTVRHGVQDLKSPKGGPTSTFSDSLRLGSRLKQLQELLLGILKATEAEAQETRRKPRARFETLRASCCLSSPLPRSPAGIGIVRGEGLPLHEYVGHANALDASRAAKLRTPRFSAARDTVRHSATRLWTDHHRDFFFWSFP